MAGTGAARAKLEEWIAKAPAAAQAAAVAMAAVAMRETQAQLGTSSHPKGTPTPSAPGSPPSLISGQLRRSVIMQPVAPGHVRVGATAVYARIQELGGDSGPGHMTHLPARPYLAPALKKAAESGALTEAAMQVIQKVLEA
jgi:phage gpG-like protein